MVGAPLGNRNATKAKPWVAAIERALAKRSLVAQRDALDDLAEKLLTRCDDGGIAALKELGDRLDGRTARQLTLLADVDHPLFAELRSVDEFARFLSKTNSSEPADTSRIISV